MSLEHEKDRNMDRNTITLKKSKLLGIKIDYKYLFQPIVELHGH